MRRECFKSIPISVKIEVDEIRQIQEKEQCSLLRAIATGLIGKKGQEDHPPEKSGFQRSYCDTLKLLLRIEESISFGKSNEDLETHPPERADQRLSHKYLRSLLQTDLSGFTLLDSSHELVKGLVWAAKKNPHFRSTLDEDYGGAENLLKGNREAVWDYKTAYHHADQNGLGPPVNN